MGNARGVSRVTAAATHDWLGYDMAPCKFYEGRAAVTTSSSETKPDYLGGPPRHLHPPPRLTPETGDIDHDGVVKCLTSRP